MFSACRDFISFENTKRFLNRFTNSFVLFVFIVFTIERLESRRRSGVDRDDVQNPFLSVNSQISFHAKLGRKFCSAFASNVISQIR